MKLLLRIIVSGFAIWLATVWCEGIELVGTDGSTQTTLIVLGVVAVVFGLVNAVIKPLVAMLSLPLYILTLGLFTLVVNALMLMLTAWITSHLDWGITVDGFGWALLGALIISVVSFILNAVLRTKRD